jgi:superfamily II DNA or RNA helicase
MGYFAVNYNSIRYPIAENDQPGLRKAQVGAIHSISSHFTVSKQPGIVIMPTGTGKTAVLMMCPFVLKANRVLVITPSKLVRNQIAVGFSELQPLRNLGVLSNQATGIRVKELTSEIRSMNMWAELSNYQVVISTPKCISPGIEGIQPSDPNFFDLILIDEAHHSPASSWIDIINHYTSASIVLFTTTPRHFEETRKKFQAKSYTTILSPLPMRRGFLERRNLSLLMHLRGMILQLRENANAFSGRNRKEPFIILW